MKSGLIILAIASLGFVANLSANTLRIDSGQSRVQFTVRHFLGTVKGQFGDVQGTVRLDRGHPENSTVKAQIAVKTIDTGIKKRDHHLLAAEFFNAEKFPLITFISRSVRKTGGSTADVIGDFTMHGITRAITLHATLLTGKAGEGNARWRLTTDPLPRFDYGLRWSAATEAVSMIGKEVTINLEIVAELAR